MKMTGAQMVVKMLEKNGISRVFGYPGAANCPIIDRLSFTGIKHILVRNEQGAAHMASGYACVTKTVGVCTATSGPGATNLITGIATAYMDSVPIVAITGQVATSIIGKDAFQEVDIIGATMPFTKHNYLIKNGLDIQRVMAEAFHIAKTGRPGPVLIDIPMDILKAEFDYPDEEPPVNIRGYRLVGKANESQIKKAAEIIKNSKRPVIMTGGGFASSDCVEEFGKFAEKTKIPVVTTMMGIGVIPTDSENFFGMVGSHGLRSANSILNNSDTVIIMGARLGDRAVFNANSLEKRANLIHIDIDPAEIGKNMLPLIPIVGDLKDVLSQLIPLTSDYRTPTEWLETANNIRKEHNVPYVTEDTGFVNPKYFMRRLSEKTDSDVYITTEVGQNQLWAANNFIFKKPRMLITSAGFGTMGYGLPAAIGASVASDQRDKRKVVAVMGDGSFQMDLPELATICQWGINVKMVVFKNDRLGMVHEHQFLLYKSNYQAVTLEGSPDFCKLADAYGIPSGRISENSQIDEGIDRLMNGEGSYLLVVDVDPNEPTGGALNQTRM
ncbi:MAG: biosynthetic-type acetolactate synthase large subunit [Oscillospiraceae bacterium]|nr:biosynthetic-type acetolactate synthase large subunit [Oscillospiraceae bacterium]